MNVQRARSLTINQLTSFQKYSESYFTHSWQREGFHNFPKVNSPKVDLLARQEFEIS